MAKLTELTRFSDRITYLYLEKGRIEQHHKSIAYVTATREVPIPAADLCVLMLGPGITITHAAIKNLADCRCLVVWCGEESVRFYAHGMGATHSGHNTILQATAWGNPATRLDVVRRMYEKRFHEKLDPTLTLEQIRGKEGYRVRNAYRNASDAFGIEWTGRKYVPGEWNYASPINRAISAASACLNGLVHAGIVALGYCPALGFIHTGKALSFVYDIADLYKVDYLLPLAFETVANSESTVEKRVRLACRDLFKLKRLIERLGPDIKEVIDGSSDSGEGSPQPEGGSQPLDDRTEGRDIPRSRFGKSPK